MSKVLPSRARSFQGLRAGIVSRALADAIDIAVVGSLGIGILFVWSLLGSLGTRSLAFMLPGSIRLFVLGELLLCLYLWAGWSSTGRTIGKQFMGLRVVDASGRLMKPMLALLRAILCVIFPIGLLWCVVSQENRSVQDALLRTSVIYDWTLRVPQRADRRASAPASAVSGQPVGGRGPAI